MKVVEWLTRFITCCEIHGQTMPVPGLWRWQFDIDDGPARFVEELREMLEQDCSGTQTGFFQMTTSAVQATQQARAAQACGFGFFELLLNVLASFLWCFFGESCCSLARGGVDTAGVGWVMAVVVGDGVAAAEVVVAVAVAVAEAEAAGGGAGGGGGGDSVCGAALLLLLLLLGAGWRRRWRRRWRGRGLGQGRSCVFIPVFVERSVHLRRILVT